GMTLLVRTAGEPLVMMDVLQREIQDLNPNVQGFFPRTLLQHVGFSLLPAKMAAALSTVFAGLALMLAGIGIYGVIAYSVAQRSREIGIRAALGASPRDILQLFLNEGLRWTIGGILFGCAAAFAVMRLASNFLYGISPADPITFLSGILILVLLIISATFFPARRAARIDPIFALRYE
ncbi:MAG TPA: FtsX-like permease family protein, partial [Acidobacteriota bacterium]